MPEVTIVRRNCILAPSTYLRSSLSLSVLSALQSLFLVPESACHVNFDGVLDEGDGPSASEDSLAFSEDSLSSSSSFLQFRSVKVLSAHLLHVHPLHVLTHPYKYIHQCCHCHQLFSLNA